MKNISQVSSQSTSQATKPVQADNSPCEDESISSREVQVEKPEEESRSVVLSKYLCGSETKWSQVCHRVANFISSIEKTNGERLFWYRKYMELLLPMKFVPAGSILANSDHSTGGLNNCFVLGAEDNMESIVELVKDSLLTTRFRGGIGIHISGELGARGYIRPKGASYKDGKALGPLAVFDMISQTNAELTTGSKCFAEGTLINTDAGYRPIEEIYSDIKTEDSTGATTPWRAVTHEGLKNITAVFDNGRQEVYRITTTRGYSVDVTEGHKMAYLDNDGCIQLQAVEEMEPTDSVLLCLSNNERASETIVQGFSPDEPHETMPLTPGIAYLLGYFQTNRVEIEEEADSTFSILFRCNDLCMADRIAQLVKEAFLVEPKITEFFFQKRGEKDPSPAGYRVEISNALWILEWLERNRFVHSLKTYYKTVYQPLGIARPFFHANSTTIGAFLSGHFDALGRTSRGGSSYSFICPDLCESKSLQLLLLNYGIVSRVRALNRKGRKRLTYSLVVSGTTFKERLVLLLAESWKLAAAPFRASRDKAGGHSLGVLKRLDLSSRRFVGSKGKHLSLTAMQKISGHKSVAEDPGKIAFVEGLLNLFPDEIETIQPIGVRRTYDIEVEDVHLLSAGGIYTSNSRRGAFLFSMDWRHPDVFDFIKAKTESYVDGEWAKSLMELAAKGEDISSVFAEGWTETHLSPKGKRKRRWHNANISVHLDEEFFKKFAEGEEFAVRLFDQITEYAHKTADPGILFIDNARNSPLGAFIETTNPCGEIPLPRNSSCNLGSLVIPKFLKKGTSEIDYESLACAVKTAVRFLDSVLDKSKYATEIQKQSIQGRYRQLGLGIMGWSDFLKAKGVAYHSQENLDLIKEVNLFIARTAYRASEDLALERGPCGVWDEIRYINTGASYQAWMDDEAGFPVQRPRRNSCILSVAPTGSIAQLAGCSWAFEPDFGLAIWKQIFVDASLMEQGWVQILNPYLEELGLNEEDHQIVLKTGSLAGTQFATDNPEKAAVYKIANEISPEWHIRVQSAFQRCIDQSISKTINLKSDATVEQIKALYLYAHEMGLKGITVYRDGTLASEPVRIGSLEDKS